VVGNGFYIINELRSEDEKTKVKKAAQIMISCLLKGDRPVREIYEACEAQGISKTTVKNAKKLLGIRDYVMGRQHFWQLPIDPPYKAIDSLTLIKKSQKIGS